MKKSSKIIVQDIAVTFISKDGSDYLSLTDMAKSKNAEFPADVIKNWLKTRFTIDFICIWEQMQKSKFLTWSNSTSLKVKPELILLF